MVDLTDEQKHELAMEAVKVKVGVELLTEAIPVGAVFKRLPDGLIKWIPGEGSKELKNWVVGTFGEGAQEGLVEVVNTLYDEARLKGMDIDEAWDSISWSAVGHAMAVGTGVGGLLTTPGTVVDVVAKKTKGKANDAESSAVNTDTGEGSA